MSGFSGRFVRLLLLLGAGTMTALVFSAAPATAQVVHCAAGAVGGAGGTGGTDNASGGPGVSGGTGGRGGGASNLDCNQNTTGPAKPNLECSGGGRGGSGGNGGESTSGTSGLAFDTTGGGIALGILGNKVGNADTTGANGGSAIGGTGGRGGSGNGAVCNQSTNGGGTVAGTASAAAGTGGGAKLGTGGGRMAGKLGTGGGVLARTGARTATQVGIAGLAFILGGLLLLGGQPAWRRR